MVVTYRDLVAGLRALDLERDRPVIAHASLSAFGEVRGGAETVLGALLMTLGGLMMPVFTYKTMLIPETGPEGNGMTYGSGRDLNQMAEFFRPEMPADRMMGVVAERLRQHAQAQRSIHPILSFAGVGVKKILQTQTLAEPFAPIRSLVQDDGWVLLLGVDQTVNTSIHYAEQVFGQAGFVRWALTPGGVCECPNFPGCSLGFEKAAPWLKGMTRSILIGNALVQALPLQPMVQMIVELLQRDPLALACDHPDCERCNSLRKKYA